MDAVYALAVPFRQLSSLLIALILVMGAALFVVTRDGDDSTETAPATTTTAPTTTLATTQDFSSSTTTPVTTIPAACVSGTVADPDSAGSPDTTSPDSTTTSPDSTTTTASPDSTTTSVAPTLGGNSSVTTVGLDTVTFGLTVKQAEAAAGTTMIPCSPVSSCYRVAPADAPEGISFVVDSGTIERVDITDGPVTTRSGLGVGTDESLVVERLGDKIDRQVNDDGSIDLIFVPTDAADADFRIIFTIRDGVVDTFRSGRVPLVLPADPCAA